MRHGDLLNLIYKHKRYCTATEVSKDSERAGKMFDCSMQKKCLTAQWLLASMTCQGWKWWRIWRQGLDRKLFRNLLTASDTCHAHIHVAAGELGEREEKGLWWSRNFRFLFASECKTQHMPSNYLILSLQWLKESKISGVKTFILFRRGFRNSGRSVFKTATMGLLFSFPQTLSRAHDPKGKKAGTLTSVL